MAQGSISCDLRCVRGLAFESTDGEDGLMPIQLLFVDGCSHQQVAGELLRLALAAVGRSDDVEAVLVRTPDEAHEWGFTGRRPCRWTATTPSLHRTHRSGSPAGATARAKFPSP